MRELYFVKNKKKVRMNTNRSKETLRMNTNKPPTEETLITIPNQKEIIEYLTEKKKLDDYCKEFYFKSTNWGYDNCITVRIYEKLGMKASICLTIHEKFVIDKTNKLQAFENNNKLVCDITTWQALNQQIKEYHNIRNSKEKFLALIIPKTKILQKCVCCLEIKGSEHCQVCNACICCHCITKLKKEVYDEYEYSHTTSINCPVCRATIERNEYDDE